LSLFPVLLLQAMRAFFFVPCSLLWPLLFVLTAFCVIENTLPFPLFFRGPRWFFFPLFSWAFFPLMSWGGWDNSSSFLPPRFPPPPSGVDNLQIPDFPCGCGSSPSVSRCRIFFFCLPFFFFCPGEVLPQSRGRGFPVGDLPPNLPPVSLLLPPGMRYYWAAGWRTPERVPPLTKVFSCGYYSFFFSRRPLASADRLPGNEQGTFFTPPSSPPTPDQLWLLVLPRSTHPP